MKFLDLIFDLSAYFFRRGREINTGDKNITTGGAVFCDGLRVEADGVIEVGERASPGTPPSGYLRVYAKADGKLYYMGDGGVEKEVATV